ncbi:MAG TPA: DUF2306 domain-containing protein [Gemmatimonadaceae bacterium]|nr:DUF2306 domain-containing protein [Gemmatimonadaceae bacterium]
MRLAGISVVGWMHTLACTLALFLGAVNIVAVKGSASHKRRGWAYVVSMVVANALTLFIYHFDLPLTATQHPGPGIFGFFHALAVAALLLTLAGAYASTRQERALWAYAHPTFMILSYYVLLGGLVNELFARVEALRPYAVTVVDGRQTFGSPVLGMTQSAVMLATFLMLVLFAVKVWRYRRTARSVARG